MMFSDVKQTGKISSI